MKTKQDGMVVRASVAAVQAALLALSAVSVAQGADVDDAIRQQTRPTNTIEVGAGYVSEDSFKFGEYNGLFNKGLFGIFNLDLSGGGAYGSGDPTRWRLVGTDLGLDTRNVAAEYGEQGRFRINLGFDELRRMRSDTYQTPFLGAGSDTLTLPSNWLKPFVPQVNANNINFRSLSPTTGLAPSNVAGVVTPPTAAQQATVNNIIAADRPAFHNVDLDTKRTTYEGGFSYNIDRNWAFKVSAKHEKKDGLKPLGTVTSQVSEYSTVIPDPIDQTTDQYNVSLTYTGDKAFMQVAYYGSVFKNDVQRTQQRFPPVHPDGRLQLLADDQAGDECVLRPQHAGRRIRDRRSERPVSGRLSGVVAQRTGRDDGVQRPAYGEARQGREPRRQLQV